MACDEVTLIKFYDQGSSFCAVQKHLCDPHVQVNLVVNAIILWNTIYMQAIIKQLRTEGYQISDEDLRHLGPARHEHINPYGHYAFNVQHELQRKGLRPLRTP